MRAFSSILLLCVSIFVGIAAAQSPMATITGRVVDPSGAVISNARVEVRNEATGSGYAAVTNGAGMYVVPNLQPGIYRVEVSKQSFKTLIKPDVVLQVQDVLALNVTLPLGSTAESVTVTGGAAVVNTESATVKTVVDERLVNELPLNGRSFQTLFELTPGVTVAAANFNNPGQFSINGQRTSANYFMVDGVSANTGISGGFPPGQSLGGSQPALTAFGGTNGLVSVDAVQEFAIQTSSYAAEFGRTPGGQISIVTKSGTNGLHGEAFDYLRNEVFDANDWFANEKGLKRAALRQNDFGGVLGGPISRNKTFYFLSYEGLRLRQPTTGFSDVPTVAVRAAAATAIQPYLNAFPLPSRNGVDHGNGLAEADYSFSNPTQLDSGGIRLDHHVNDALALFARYNYGRSSTAVRGSGFSLNTISSSPFSLQTLTLGATYEITPRMADEIRFNWSRSSAAGDFKLDSFGGAVPLNPAVVFPAGVNTKDSQFFLFILNGQNTQLGLGPNVNNRQSQINLVENLSWQRNTHLLKFGLDYRRLTPVFDPFRYSQFDAVNDIRTLLSMTSDVTFVASYAGAVHGIVSNYSIYFQDTWRPTARFAATYGVRWDYDPAPDERASNGLTPAVVLATPDFSTVSFAPPGTALYRATRDNFAPRLGVAYTLHGGNNLEGVIRAGVGVFYDLGNGVVGNTLAFYPFIATSNSFNQPFPPPAGVAAPPALSNSPPFPAVQAFPHFLKQPYTYHTNLSYEQSLGSNQTLTLGYVGSAAHSLIRGLDVFSPPLPMSFQEIRFVTNDGYSNYNSLQATFRRNGGKGLAILGSYTLSHSLDNASDDQGTNAPTQLVSSKSDYGSSDFDIRHTGTIALDYAPPVPRLSRVADAVLRGWGLNTLVVARSSPPVNVTIQRFLNFGPYTLRPDRVPGVPLYIDDPATPGERRFNSSALSDPVVQGQGNLERNLFRGFSLVQVDFSIRRRFKLTEKMWLQARLEAFNLLNHPNFAPQVGSLGTEIAPGQLILNPAFGISQSMLNQGLNGFGGSGFSPLYQIGGPRSLQVAMKLEF